MLNKNQGGFGPGGVKRVKGATGKKSRVFDQVRSQQQEKNRKKNQFKAGKNGKGGKRPGKNMRKKGGKR